MLKNLPIIRGLCKMRNESHIIKDVLDNWAGICTGGIYLYDDVSDDNTVDIARTHSAVKDIIQGTYWDPDRERAEWFNRQQILMRAQQDSGPDDWFVYFDMDEFLFNFEEFDLFNKIDVKAIACRLWDVAITPEDVNLPYNKRQWVGPEYRTIVFFFRNDPALKYHLPDQRIVTLPDVGIIPIEGSIKHFGKGYSIEKFEETCDYYVKFWSKYSDKWRKRKGHAIHEDYKSDFGNPLVKWKDRMKGFSLESKIYGQN